MNPEPVIHPDAVRAAKALRRADPLMKRVIDQVGPCNIPAPHGREPFEALLRAIAHQQLHGKAAEAILNRFTALFSADSFPTPDQILGCEDALLRSVGLSAGKTAAIRDLCHHTTLGTVPDLAQAARISNEELIARLVTIRGIGRWSVEMFLIFGLGRPDVLPVDDFGVREGYRKASCLDAQPKPKALAALGEVWAPWRSFAAWYFWQANNFTWTP